MPRISGYIYDPEVHRLRCVACGGLGNAASVPFLDLRFGYIPSHSHKEGCPEGARILVRTARERSATHVICGR